MTASHPQQNAAALNDDQEAAAKARSAIVYLTDAFDSMAAAGKITVHAETSHVFKAMYGWWVGIVRSSRAVVLLYDSGLCSEADPIVRSILQHALVLQWVVDVGDDALDAITEHGENEHGRMQRHAQRAGWSFPVAGGKAEPRRTGAPHRLSSQRSTTSRSSMATSRRPATTSPSTSSSPRLRSSSADRLGGRRGSCGRSWIQRRSLPFRRSRRGRLGALRLACEYLIGSATSSGLECLQQLRR